MLRMLRKQPCEQCGQDVAEEEGIAVDAER